ncbi:fungal-specific transcription factor domain-containing protein [Dichotomocladium elegans]|nr:fungal-specific transcription factor domain-containing protein [Dichotomocladium elegans]
MSLPTHQAQAQQGRSPSSSKQVRLPPTDRMPASSIIGDGITQYRKRKRERACDLCRRKKIRCDYDHTCPDRACSSCSGYGKMCTFLEAARKRGPSKLYVKGLEDRLRRMEELLMSATGKVGQLSPEQMKELGKLSSEPPEDDDKDAPARPICRESLPVDDTVRSDTAVADIAEKENPGIQRWELLADDQQRTFSSSLRGDARYFYMGSSSGVHLINKLLQDDGGASSRYGPNKTSGGEEEDMMVPRFRDDNVSMKITCGYQSMEKWEVPPQEIVDRLVELYFMKMNIYFPIVDKAEFYESYQKGGDALCTPLLLAICRSACRLLDADDWVVKKFNINRNQLFVDITNELERKFVVDFLNPNIEYIQVFLITALSARRWTPESTDWLGVSIAVKMAQDLGLHRSDTRLGMSIKRREARKRLWWSAYVMDRWICAALRRPLAISDADCDVELPSVDSEDDRFSFLVHMTKLSAILGDILRVLCSPRARNLGDRRPGVDQN